MGDKALLWGTIFSVILSGIGFTAWLTQVASLASSTAQAQDRMRDELAKHLDAMDLRNDQHWTSEDTKLGEINTRVSHIEGALQGTK